MNLHQEAPQQDDTASGTGSEADLRGAPMSFGSAVRALLQGARVGRARAGMPGDRWLMVRIEEVLRGFDEIQEAATHDEPEATPYASDTPPPVILAPRARALVLEPAA